jgi:hypothetical protein
VRRSKQCADAPVAQLVHPREQVARLWEHWGRPEIVRYHGGHTGFFRSRPMQRFIDDALVQSGLVNPDEIDCIISNS